MAGEIHAVDFAVVAEQFLQRMQLSFRAQSPVKEKCFHRRSRVINYSGTGFDSICLMMLLTSASVFRSLV
jgi:hypothetical protein